MILQKKPETCARETKLISGVKGESAQEVSRKKRDKDERTRWQCCKLFPTDRTTTNSRAALSVAAKITGRPRCQGLAR